MKEYVRGGQRHLWYAEAEIETMMVDELTRARLLPSPENESVEVNLEALVSRHLKVALDQHAPLDAEVLGVTRFQAGKKPRIEINRDLTGSALDDEDATPGLIGRWRATLAHEASHVLLHQSLFDVNDMRRGTFAFAQEQENREGKLLRCLKRNVSFRRTHDWKEVQANKGMAALLMPKPVFIQVVRQERRRLGLGDVTRTGTAEADALTAEVARRCVVSKQAASIRLQVLAITGSSAALALR